MSSAAFSRSSISKQRGAEMSSRLIPPNPGAIALHHGDDLVRIAGVEADRERVDAGELLEQHRLALHHRHRRARADVAEPEHRGAVGDDRDGVALDRVLEGLVGILVDRAADPRDARACRPSRGRRGSSAGSCSAARSCRRRGAGRCGRWCRARARPARALTASVSRGQSAESAGLDGDVADRVRALDLNEVDGADRAAGLADRARDLAEHPGPVIDLDPEGEAVLGAGCGWRIERADSLTARRCLTSSS